MKTNKSNHHLTDVQLYCQDKFNQKICSFDEVVGKLLTVSNQQTSYTNSNLSL